MTEHEVTTEGIDCIALLEHGESLPRPSEVDGRTAYIKQSTSEAFVAAGDKWEQHVGLSRLVQEVYWP